MVSSGRIIQRALITILSTWAVVGCVAVGASTNPQTQAINEIRAKLGLPGLALEFVETTTMINSPNGDLKVALYQDGEGRKYSVDPETNQVVEIDARAILSSIPSNQHAMTQDQLRALAEKMMTATTPDFDARLPTLAYDEGNKGDNYFFTWTEGNQAGALNHPFAQIGLHVSGDLFAYYNTLSLK